MTWINNLYQEIVSWLGYFLDVNWSYYLPLDYGPYACAEVLISNLVMAGIIVVISALVFSVFKIISSVIMRCIDDTYY